MRFFCQFLLLNLGVNVDYAYDLEDTCPAGKIAIRCILLLWKGDYPAQCEVGKFINGGKCACRRDKIEGNGKFYLSVSLT